MTNQYVNKVALSDGTTLIDLTSDTAVEAKVLDGYYFHKATGERVEGACTYDADTSDATATDAEILSGVSAYVNGNKISGAMTNQGAIEATIDDLTAYTVPAGYHDGTGTVSIDSTEAAKIVAGNIKSGVEILGVTGEYGGEAVSAQSKSATPGWSQQTVLPDSGYDYLSQVTVAAIPVTYSDNVQGGRTCTIGPAQA